MQLVEQQAKQRAKQLRLGGRHLLGRGRSGVDREPRARLRRRGDAAVPGGNRAGGIHAFGRRPDHPLQGGQRLQRRRRLPPRQFEVGQTKIGQKAARGGLERDARRWGDRPGRVLDPRDREIGPDGRGVAVHDRGPLAGEDVVVLPQLGHLTQVVDRGGNLPRAHGWDRQRAGDDLGLLRRERIMIHLTGALEVEKAHLGGWGAARALVLHGRVNRRGRARTERVLCTDGLHEEVGLRRGGARHHQRVPDGSVVILARFPHDAGRARGDPRTRGAARRAWRSAAH